MMNFKQRLQDMAKRRGQPTEDFPPGYKKGDFGKSCLNCKAYDEQNGKCRKYEVFVAGNHVCDTWTPVYKD